MTDQPTPIVGPADDLLDPELRGLLSRMHDYGWLAYPADGGRKRTVSPDGRREITLALADSRGGFAAFIHGQQVSYGTAVAYVRKGTS